MHDFDRHQLAFLLSLGSISIGGCLLGDDDDDYSDDGGGGDDASETPIPTTDPDEGSDGTTGDVPATSDPSGITDPSDTSSASTDDPTDATADDSTGAPECGNVDVPDFCEPYVAHALECYGRGYFSVEYCACNVAYAQMYGDECVAAYEEYYACIIAADCEQLTAGKACGTETAALETSCTSGETTGTGG